MRRKANFSSYCLFADFLSPDILWISVWYRCFCQQNKPELLYSFFSCLIETIHSTRKSFFSLSNSVKSLSFWTKHTDNFSNSFLHAAFSIGVKKQIMIVNLSTLVNAWSSSIVQINSSLSSWKWDSASNTSPSKEVVIPVPISFFKLDGPSSCKKARLIGTFNLRQLPGKSQVSARDFGVVHSWLFSLSTQYWIRADLPFLSRSDLLIGFKWAALTMSL